MVAHKDQGQDAADENEIVYSKVTFNSSLSDEEAGMAEDEANQTHELVEDSQSMSANDLCDDTFVPDKGLDNNIWTVNENALRDLLVYLVQKYRIDEVYDSKVKAQNWEKLISEFHTVTENRVTVSNPQIIRKWHNWKQYNKARKKPHPFVVCSNVTEDSVIEKCAQLCQRAKSDAEFAAMLARGPMEAIDVDGSKRHLVSDTDMTIEEIVASKYPHSGLSRLLRNDFLVRRTGASAAALSLKRLQHEIKLESLSYEQEKWKIKLQNGKIIQEKLQKQLDLLDLKLQKAHIELALKKSQCHGLGIVI